MGVGGCGGPDGRAHAVAAGKLEAAGRRGTVWTRVRGLAGAARVRQHETRRLRVEARVLVAALVDATDEIDRLRAQTCRGRGPDVLFISALDLFFRTFHQIGATKILNPGMREVA